MGSGRGTHAHYKDVRTMPDFAFERVRSGLPMPDVVVVGRGISIGSVVEDILTLAEYLDEGEWEGQVHYLPL